MLGFRVLGLTVLKARAFGVLGFRVSAFRAFLFCVANLPKRLQIAK